MGLAPRLKILQPFCPRSLAAGCAMARQLASGAPLLAAASSLLLPRCMSTSCAARQQCPGLSYASPELQALFTGAHPCSRQFRAVVCLCNAAVCFRSPGHSNVARFGAPRHRLPCRSAFVPWLRGLDQRTQVCSWTA